MAVNATQGSPFPGLNFAGELDDIEELANEITMTEDWLAYLNRRLLVMSNANHPGRLTHVRFLPDIETGEVIMVPCGKDDYGAEELKYSETENGASVNLRLAVKRFRLQKQSGRVRVFPVTERKAPDGQVYLAFVVKNSGTRPARKLKKSQQAGAAGPAKPGEAKPEEAKPVEAKPGEAQQTPQPTTSVAAAAQSKGLE